MDGSPETALDHARRDLFEAVRVAIGRDGALLTAGELWVARRLLALPDEAASLYARLFSRQPKIFRTGGLSYAEIARVDVAAAVLVAEGFAWDARALAPAASLADALTVAELKEVCRGLGRPLSGKRADLLTRVAEADARPALAARVGPSLWLRHRGLMRRLARLYLHDHAGDLSRLVIARMEIVRYPAYTPTGGAGLFPDRRGLLGYEAALVRRALLTEARAVEDAAAAIAAVERTPRPPDHQRRFSARRFDEELVLVAARALEQRGDPAGAEELYRRLLSAGTRYAGEAYWRRALCLASLGRADEGAALCAAAREEVDPVLARALERTGRRLARAAGRGWIPLPPLLRPDVREIPLPAAAFVGVRPGYASSRGALPVEEALADALAALGRGAIYGENALWTTLFGVLFRRVLFAPVPGMLPTPLLDAPLDLGRPGFAGRRQAEIAAAIGAITAGEAPDRLREAEVAREQVRGVRWDLFTGDHLARVAEALGGPALATLMRPFAEDWSGAAHGMPDLCVLPGPEVTLPGALPGRVPACVVLAEVKGPTDALRDGQRVWLDRLIRAGVRAELWNVRREAPSESAPASPLG